MPLCCGDSYHFLALLSMYCLRVRLACTACTADVGDVDNARVLFERVLTEDANRKSVLLWERYLSFEFEMGDLQSALRLEKRAREALGELGGAAGASAARNVQLLLLRYQFLDSWACPPSQQQYLLYLMGKGPAPAGFERPRGRGAGGLGGGGDAGGDAGDDRLLGGSGSKTGAAGGSDGYGSSDGYGKGDAGAYGAGHTGMPPLLERFIMALPPDNYMDGPMPDLNLVVEALYGMEEEDGGADGDGRGLKREFEDDDAAGLGAGPGRDIYRAAGQTESTGVWRALVTPDMQQVAGPAGSAAVLFGAGRALQIRATKLWQRERLMTLTQQCHSWRIQRCSVQASDMPVLGCASSRCKQAAVCMHAV